MLAGGEWRTELTLAEKIALRDKLAALAAREGISVAAAGEDMETPGQLMARLEPHRFAMRAHLAVIDEALLWLWNTPDSNLMVWSPPRAGKSTLVSRSFPFWWLAHARGRGSRWGRMRRLSRSGIAARCARWWSSTGHSSRYCPSKEEWAAADWTLLSGGGMRSRGVGGGLTGHGSDCVSGDTRIVTEHGGTTAADAYARRDEWILGFDHVAGAAVWRRVEARRRIDGCRTVEVHAQGGRVLTCTPDHRVYTSRGYVPAGSLRLHDAVTSLDAAAGVPLRWVAGGGNVRRAQGDPQGRGGDVLQHRVPRGREVKPWADTLVPPMRRPNTTGAKADLLGRMPPRGGRGAVDVSRLPDVRGQLSPEGIEAAVLFTGLRRRGAFVPDGRGRQREPQGRASATGSGSCRCEP